MNSETSETNDVGYLLHKIKELEARTAARWFYKQAFVYNDDTLERWPWLKEDDDRDYAEELREWADGVHELEDGFRRQCADEIDRLKAQLEAAEDDVTRIELASFESEQEIKKQLAAAHGLLREACGSVFPMDDAETNYRILVPRQWLSAARAAGGTT